MLSKKVVVERLREYFVQCDGVLFAYLFGSVARDETWFHSDIDIACMCESRCSRRKIALDVSKLLEIDHIDVIDLATLRNNSLVIDLIREGVVLKDHPKREKWELERYHRALDFFASTRLVYGY